MTVVWNPDFKCGSFPVNKILNVLWQYVRNRSWETHVLCVPLVYLLWCAFPSASALQPFTCEGTGGVSEAGQLTVVSVFLSCHSCCVVLCSETVSYRLRWQLWITAWSECGLFHHFPPSAGSLLQQFTVNLILTLFDLISGRQEWGVRVIKWYINPSY